MSTATTSAPIHVDVKQAHHDDATHTSHDDITHEDEKKQGAKQDEDTTHTTTQDDEKKHGDEDEEDGTRSLTVNSFSAPSGLVLRSATYTPTPSPITDASRIRPRDMPREPWRWTCDMDAGAYLGTQGLDGACHEMCEGE